MHPFSMFIPALGRELKGRLLDLWRGYDETGEPVEHDDDRRRLILASAGIQMDSVTLPRVKPARRSAGQVGQQLLAAAMACIHRGQPTGREIGCGGCGGGGRKIPVLACAVHTECTLTASQDKALAFCQGCQDRKPPRPFEEQI